MTADAPPGLESMLGRIASALEKPRGRLINAAFGLQRAHAESADEFDALLDAVLAGLSGVDRLNGSSLIAKVTKTRECRPVVVLESQSHCVKQQLRVLLKERPGVFSRYNQQMVQGHGGNFKTLRRMLEAVA